MALIDNLVSFWKLDEASGNAVDAHGPNDLTNNNTVTYAAAKINNGAVFGGTKHLSIADASQSGLDITGNLTISFWVNFSSYNGSTVYEFIGKTNFADGNSTRTYCVEKNEGGANLLVLGIGDGATFTRKTVSWTPSTATWYHVVIVYTAAAGTADFYVDGSQQGTQQTGLPTSIVDNSRPFTLGAAFDGGTVAGSIPGSMDEVGIWARALSGAEVTELYNGGAGLAYPFGASPPPATADAIAFGHAF